MSETVTCKACGNAVAADEAVSQTAKADDDWFHEACAVQFHYILEYEYLCRKYNLTIGWRDGPFVNHYANVNGHMKYLRKNMTRS